MALGNLCVKCFLMQMCPSCPCPCKCMVARTCVSHWTSLICVDRKNIWVIASGNITHNLRDWHMVASTNGQTPAYVQGFADWVEEKLKAHDAQALIQLPPTQRRRTSGASERRPFVATFCGAGCSWAYSASTSFLPWRE
jgi:aromatic ring-opening dioxygenase catalytic subunit (LigB family)